MNIPGCQRSPPGGRRTSTATRSLICSDNSGRGRRTGKGAGTGSEIMEQFEDWAWMTRPGLKRVVAHHKLRPERQGTGNANPLALPTAEGHGDNGSCIPGAARQSSTARQPGLPFLYHWATRWMVKVRPRSARGDMREVQRGIWVLEHDLHVASQGLDLGLVQPQGR